jgi:glycerol-3-phosphate acyltransferase PlsY
MDGPIFLTNRTALRQANVQLGTIDTVIDILKGHLTVIGEVVSIQTVPEGER